MRESQYYIPKTLDSPSRIMLWTVDEFIVIFFPFLILFFKYNSPIWAVAVSMFCWFVLRKIKKGKSSRFILALLYWYFPFYMFYKIVPPSHTRKYIG
jgi:type IV conjugative transfer system protein TraL